MKKCFPGIFLILMILFGLASLTEARPGKETASALNKISQMLVDDKGDVKVIISTNKINEGQFPKECMETDLDGNYQCGPDMSWGCYQGNWVFSLSHSDAQFDEMLRSIRMALNKNQPVTVNVSTDCHLLGLNITP